MVNQAHGVPSGFPSLWGSLVQGNFNKLRKEGTFQSLIDMNSYCGHGNPYVTWTGHVMKEIRMTNGTLVNL